MKVFFDSSSYIKKFIKEHGSEEIDDHCQQASDLGLSIICLPEMISALNYLSHLISVKSKRQKT